MHLTNPWAIFESRPAKTPFKQAVKTPPGGEALGEGANGGVHLEPHEGKRSFSSRPITCQSRAREWPICRMGGGGFSPLRRLRSTTRPRICREAVIFLYASPPGGIAPCSRGPIFGHRWISSRRVTASARALRAKIAQPPTGCACRSGSVNLNTLLREITIRPSQGRSKCAMFSPASWWLWRC
jgi:hypothetical protein